MNQRTCGNLKTIYYRGSLRSCNYNCPYCPFRKSFGAEDRIRDQRALERFCLTVPHLGDNLTVMLIPYGESLIHNYYQEAIARLCRMAAIKQVGCQTNLSFSIQDFLTLMEDHSKLRLWCTFHPAQVGLDSFLEQCSLLYQNKIRFSVGAVGIPKNIEILQELRRCLPSDIYLWVNALEGTTRSYTRSERDAFLALDPLFKFELALYPAQPESCRGGKESLFVDANGTVFACPISRKKRGNIYSDGSDILGREALSPESLSPETLRFAPSHPESVHCQTEYRKAYCHCYLAYSNRSDIFDVSGFAESWACRVPNQRKAIFFDVDGTLTLPTGEIPDKHIQALDRLTQKYDLFLATSLPYSYAKKRCKAIWPNLTGGVFAEGSDIRIFTEDYKNIIPLDEDISEAIAHEFSLISKSESPLSFRAYREDGTLHKITLLNKNLPEDFPWEYLRNNLHFRSVLEGGIWGIVSQEASKLQGILEICRRLDLFEQFVTVVGNSHNDIPMLQYFSSSIAVPAAAPVVRKAAKTVCDIQEILAHVLPDPGRHRYKRR